MKVIKLRFGYDEMTGQVGFDTPAGHIYIHGENDQPAFQALMNDLIRAATAFGKEGSL